MQTVPAAGSRRLQGARPAPRHAAVLARARHVLERVLAPARFGPGLALEITAHHLDGEPVPYEEAISRPFQRFELREAWGPAWGTTWFRLRGRVPAAWAGEDVVLRYEQHEHAGGAPAGEALVWRDGIPVHSLSWARWHAVLLSPAAGGEPIDLYVEAAANPNVPDRTAGFAWPLLLPDPGGEPALVLDRCELAVQHRGVHDLALDLWTVLGLSSVATDPDHRRELDAALRAACDLVDPLDVLASAHDARAVLAGVLSRPAQPDAPRVSGVGHAHLDTAWLWPARESARKIARTLANAVSLMERYPSYHFACSAARHLAWVEERYPTLHQRVVERVRTGQLEPVGAMWVEADCNLPSGESLVRQIVHGKRWFRDHLGRDCTEVWLPDAFGYPATLPQIMAEGGVGWFVSQKLSWNDTNRFPFHTFWWEGLDGTRVRAHFPPADTYSGTMAMRELAASAAAGAPSLYPFGFGDGGGGPTEEMVEVGLRAADLEGAPRVALEPASAFFAAIEADPAPLPVWAGELYLEKHRGTYTSQAGVKLANRRGEGLLGAAELWATVSADGAAYPAAELDRAWKLLLTNQFHDILPGSSIRWVYEDARRDHAEVEATARAIVDNALAALVDAVDTTGMADPAVVFNPTAFPRRELVEVGDRAVLVAVPPFGYTAVDLGAPPGRGAAAAVELGDGWVSNGLLRVAWDEAGRIVSIWDAEYGREVVAPGRAANSFHLHNDEPLEWDAWDIDREAFERFEELAGTDVLTARVEAGGLRAVVRSRTAFGSSTMDQAMVLTAGSRRIDFVTDVDWHEEHKLLKVAFPVAVHAPHASFEIQFGHVERPTHENTSWERARFEVCAHRWADLSEAGYGVALLNDCKYGYDVRGNVLRLSLLRAPTAPDPTCDRGRHRFTYSLLPHAGDLREGGVVAAGYALNAPLEVRPTTAHTGARPASASFVSTAQPGFVVETVKRGDDGEGIVLRGYEAHGGRCRVRLRVGLPFTAAARADLLEAQRHPLDVDGDEVVFDVRPFELVTLRLR